MTVAELQFEIGAAVFAGSLPVTAADIENERAR